MNKIPATVTAIERADTINIVSFGVAGQTMRMMALELDRRLTTGTEVILGAKATNIALAKEINSLMSISNQLPVKVEDVDLGVLLCSVKFRFAGHLLESIITRESALKMGLDAGDEIVALIKSSELSIVEVL